MTETLRYVVYGEAEVASLPTPTLSSSTAENGVHHNWHVLAISEGVSIQEAEEWQQYVSIAPMTIHKVSNGDKSQAVGIFDGPAGDFILARVYSYTEATPIYQCIYIPQAVLRVWSGYWSALVAATEYPLPVTPQKEPLERLTLPEIPTLVVNRRVELLHQLTTRYGVGVKTLLILLDAILMHGTLTICGFLPDLKARLALTEGVSMLLPASAQVKLTFSTNIISGETTPARLAFSEDNQAVNGRYVWAAKDGTTAPLTPAHPYIQHLHEVWNTDLRAFSSELMSIDNSARHWRFNSHLGEELEAFTQVEVRREGLDIEAWKAILAREDFTSEGLRPQDINALLHYALEERNVEIATALAHLMEADDALNNTIIQRLNTLLPEEPDAVYFFIRTRLAENFDEAWLPWLHSAAVSALQVAITDGDNDTLMDWFKLIAREPASYQLGDVLQEGIIAAQSRTHEDGILGSRLITFASKRRPVLINLLINDEEVLAALEAPLGPALREFAPASVAAAVELGREIGLVVLGRAAQYITTMDNAAAAFSAAHVNFLWALLEDSEAFDQLPEHYQPATIITTLIENGVGRLSSTALQAILAQLILQENERMFTFATHLVQQTMLAPTLLGVFQEHDLAINQVLKITNGLMEEKILPYQRGVDLYLRLGAYLEWQDDVMPLVEQVTRLVQQHNLLVPLDTYWQMLEIAERNKSDFAARVITRQILTYTGQLTDETNIIEAVIALKKRVAWSQSAEAAITTWWRQFIHEQPLTRLQLFNAAIDGRRAVDDLRSIVQTTSAMRRMLNKGSLEDFAGAVGTAYTLLQAISDSFDPVNKQSVSFDEETVRVEMDLLDQELTPDERSVLAKNLRELAQLITDMSDHRSKASLMRREEDIERGLLTGEQQPQSAIDTMKWMSGYLNGTQTTTDDDE